MGYRIETDFKEGDLIYNTRWNWLGSFSYARDRGGWISIFGTYIYCKIPKHNNNSLCWHSDDTRLATPEDIARIMVKRMIG